MTHIQVYPLVFTIIFGVVCLIGIGLLIINRKHPYLKFRDTKFLIIQNIGILASATITSLYMCLRPHFSCYVYYVGALLPYPGLILILAIRYWQYCVSFHIAQVRTKLRTSSIGEKDEVVQTERHSWFLRNRWAISPRFLNVVFVVGFFVLISPVVPEFFLRGQYDYLTGPNVCDIYTFGSYMTVLIVVFFLFFFASLSYMMWGCRDAYHVKTEMLALALLWATIFLIWIPYAFVSHDARWRAVPPSFWILMGLYGSFITLCVFPLVLVRLHPIEENDIEMYADVEAAKDYKWMMEQLTNARFRNAFHDYMKLQFCQENLLFYEVVMDWKLINPNDSHHYEIAETIMNSYIIEDSVCQVNVSGRLRNQVKQEIQPNLPLSPAVFDDVLKEVLGMIYSNSLFSFKSHPLYNKI